MKTLLFSLVLCLALPFSAVAAEDTDSPEYYSIEHLDDRGSGGLTEEDVMDLIEAMQTPQITTLYRSSEITSPAAMYALDPEDQTMRDVVVLILGEYVPQMQTVTEYLSDGTEVTYTEVVPGVAGLDWNWIGGAALFTLALFSFFKIVGVVLKNG
ncbi:MAG: hypothetical protein IKU20_08855 [Lachnospiraceae bacterium]|nr:hypothetical protein [Lachnospiraceae bacterium]